MTGCAKVTAAARPCRASAVDRHDRCWQHLTHEERRLIAARRAAYLTARGPDPDGDPACWSWPVTDTIRAAITSGRPLDLAFALHAWDGGRCHLCGRPVSDPVEDHDHLTDRVRGWLCRSCNVAEGHHRLDGGVWERWRERPAYALLGIEHYYGAPL